MIRRPTIALVATTLALMLAGQAFALTLSNRDTVERRLLITEGTGDAVTHDIFIGADQTVDELCQDGCTIVLENGQPESFEGYENVIIEDGRFVIE